MNPLQHFSRFIRLRLNGWRIDEDLWFTRKLKPDEVLPEIDDASGFYTYDGLRVYVRYAGQADDFDQGKPVTPWTDDKPRGWAGLPMEDH